MSSMTDNETYNGYANRETWAFNLHWQNDQGLYNETLERAREALTAKDEIDHETDDSELGEVVVTYWRDMIDDWFVVDQTRRGLPEHLQMFDREVGSWWRVDATEVGEAVRESLEDES